MIEKSAAVPEELAMIASLEPVVSLTTVAVTPRLAPLMAVAKSFRLSPAAPVPVAIVTVAPALVVNVTDDDARGAVGLDSRSEYQAPVLARLLITTVCTPATVPVAAVAVRSFGSDEATVRAANGPARVFSDCMSVSRAAVAV